MRLLQHRENGDISLTEHVGKPPPYAILSHTWGADNDEVTFRDLVDGTGTEKEGYRKLKFCGQQAARHGLEYYWIDTCCIDKTSSAELSEAINSMFRWYQNSAKCYVYLADVSTAADDSFTQWKPALERSKWFTRGWTLQELIAPRKVEIYSHEGTLLGDRVSLLQTLHEVTGVALNALQGSPLAQFSIEERLSWAAKRTTKREEDAAYSLLGLFDVHMSLIYGEGREKAFKRLFREIEGHEKVPIVKGLIDDQNRAERLERIYHWLAATDPSSNYQQALRQRQGKTGLWLMDSEEYRKWKNEPCSFLWLYGIPGSGKTILSSTIICDILNNHQSRQETAILYFYFDFNDAQKQNVDSMLRSLIYQLSQQLDNIPSSLDNLYTLYSHGRQQLTAEILTQVLQDLTQKFEQSYMVLDALDECSQRDELMHVLAMISQWRPHNVHIVVTSRRERQIENGLQSCGASVNSICLSSKVVDEDIRHFVRQRLSYDKALEKWSKDIALRDEIETVLIKGSQGMFRWTVCQLDTLGKCRNRATLRNALATLPKTLENTYDRILHSITEEDSVYATRILQWLTFAERPLALQEIAEAVAVIADRDPVFDAEEVLQDPMEILDICSSLVTVRESGDMKGNSQKQIAVLAHYSVKEYLLSPRISVGNLAKYSMNHEAYHGVLARACIGYLLQNLQDFQITPKSGTVQERATLLDYCVEYWMIHVEEAGIRQAQTTRCAVNFLSLESIAYQNWLHLYYSRRRPWDTPDLASSIADVAHPLYYAALFRLAEVVRLLLENGADANAQGGQLGTALHAAAGSNYEGTVKLLLSHGARVNQLSPRYGSAIQIASEFGHEAVIKALIDGGGDVNAKGGMRTTESYDWTPINSASIKGDFQVVKLLIENGADVNTASSEGWTPVNSASSSGNSDLVKLLLSAGANISTSNDEGWTPLIVAVDGHHHDVVKVLLEHGTSSPFLNAMTKEGHSALSCALEKGYIDIVQLLLAKGVSTVQENLYGVQAVACAAINGHNNILELLLRVSEDGANHRDRYGRSALWWAAAYNRPRTVEFLLHELHSDPNVADACGRTPFMLATRKGYRNVVDVLEESGNIFCSKEDIAVRHCEEEAALMCDICELGIHDADPHYHYSICAKGDWDICAECKGHGMTCLDHAHTLTKVVYKTTTS